MNQCAQGIENLTNFVLRGTKWHEFTVRGQALRRLQKMIELSANTLFFDR